MSELMGSFESESWFDSRPARNLCKRPAAQHPATMKVAGTSVELVSTV